MTSLALLVLRVTVGGLLAGHGAQKLFGWFEGPGPEGATMFMASLKLQPARRWAFLAGISEFLGGSLAFLGLLNPVGPFLAIGSMATASLTAHAGKPIWSTKGGAELPVTNIAALAAIALAGPGWMSLDAIFRTRVPWWFSFLVLTAVGAGVAAALEPEAIPLPAPTPERIGGPVPFEGSARREAERAAAERPEVEATR